MTGGTSTWRLVAAREMRVKMRDRTFLLSTAFMVLVLAASFGVSAFLANRTSTVEVAVAGSESASLVVAAAELAERDGGTELEAVEVASVAEAEDLLRATDVDLALLPAGDGWEVVADSEVDGGARDLLAEAVSAAMIAENARSAGTTSATVLNGADLTERLLDADAIDPGLRTAVGFVFALLFYITALTFGLSIAQSVIEEKQSRVVEILAAAIPLRGLLAGKVIGNSLLAIGQVALLSLVGLGGMAASGRTELLAVVGPAGLWFVLFFVLGFAALACLWAVAGSVATRQEELQATTMPVTTVVMTALFVGLFGSGQVLTVASFVPLVSSVAMPARVLAGDVPLWQSIASAGLVAVTAVVLVRIGARLYEGSLLRTDRRTGLVEALRGADSRSEA
ncbi:MAG TPA: ABC transporter permease [Actinomycetales bacterium]|nr:ABC transporter permease [Actinomycetales bacterium]